MASLFGNHRLKLVDEEYENTTRSNGDSSFRKDWGSLLKPTGRGRSLDSKLAIEDSMTSFDAESVFSSAEGSGEVDSMAPQSSIVGANPLEVPKHRSGRSATDSMTAIAPTQRSQNSLGGTEFDSMMPQTGTLLKSLSNRNRLPPTGALTAAPSMFSVSQASFSTITHSNSSFHQLDTSSSPFFDPNGAYNSFLLDEEADEIENSGRPSAITPSGFLAPSRSIFINESVFSVPGQNKDEGDDDISSPVQVDAPKSSFFLKQKIGLDRNEMLASRRRTSRVKVNDPSLERSRSRRPLPAQLLLDSDYAPSPSSSSSDRSLRGSLRKTLRSHGDNVKASPRISGGIDMSKAEGLAREKSTSLRDHRNSVRSKQQVLRRSGGVGRTKSFQDRAIVDGILEKFLEEDLLHDFETRVQPNTGIARQNKASGGGRKYDMDDIDSSNKAQIVPTITDEDDGSTDKRLLEDVGFPEPYYSRSPVSRTSRKSGKGTEDRSSRASQSFKSPRASRRKERKSTGAKNIERSRTLDKVIASGRENQLREDVPRTPKSKDKERVGSNSSNRGVSSKALLSKHLADDQERPTLPPTPSTPETLKSTDTKKSSRTSSRTVHHRRRKSTEELETICKTPKAVIKSAQAAIRTPPKSAPSRLDTSFASTLKRSEATETRAPTKRLSVRDQATVEPNFIRTRKTMLESFPPRTSALGNSKPHGDTTLDSSGHSINHTHGTNWNWEDDHWDVPTLASQPTTIQEEEDKNVDQSNVLPSGFGIPPRHARKTTTSGFMSPVVHPKKKVSARQLPEINLIDPPPNEAALGNVLDVNQKEGIAFAANWIEPPQLDQSFASDPLDDAFGSSTKEVQRSKIFLRTPRHSNSNLQHRNSYISSSGRRRGPANATNSDIQSPDSDDAMDSFLSPRGVIDSLFDASTSSAFRSPESATSFAFIAKKKGRPLLSARRGSHEQRKGAVRDAMFNFLDEGVPPPDARNKE